MALACLLSIQPSPAADHVQKHKPYKNPILFADYSDPDVIRVKDDYFLVASSFHFMPGLPILKSKDLVNWTIIGHVYPRLDLDPAYDMIDGNRYGGGAWAPAIRIHDGKFFVFFPTPNEGIFMCSATNPAGPWTKPLAVIQQGGLEDPCPFWDDDGNAYLIHSRLGAGPLILHKMKPDGTGVLDDGKVIVEDPKELPTLEGPKLYKKDGYYYIFAPFGGVEGGSQTVLRSKNIYGPYEHRTVLAQGTTSLKGPHQGGYVETPNGEGWFVHFNSEGAYGRITYLEPVRWADHWPIMGNAGEPVLYWPRPNVGKTYPELHPQTSDEFSGKTLSPQWEWNHNPVDDFWSLSERRGFLRLKAMPAHQLTDARNTLTELMQDPAFDLTVRLDVIGMKDGDDAGIAMLSDKASGIGIRQIAKRKVLLGFSETGLAGGPNVDQPTLQLRVHVEDQKAVYAYSLDNGKSFRPLGVSAPLHFAWWKATRPSIYCFNSNSAQESAGFVDVDWVHYVPSATIK